MPESSAKTCACVSSSPVLTAYSVAFLRPLLRSIAMWQRGRSRLAPLDPDEGFDDIDVEATPHPETHQAGDLDHALNDPYAVVPVAHTMTNKDITATIEVGVDPWAHGSDDTDDMYVYDPPVPLLIAAARFAATMSDTDIVSQVTTPRAVSLIVIPDRVERKTAWKNIDHVLQKLADFTDLDDQTWRGFKTPVCTTDAFASAHRTFAKNGDFEPSVATAVSGGHKIIALVPDAKTMSPVVRAMCCKVLNWPTLTGEMIIEILRVTHTTTGTLSEDALREILPSDADISTLPLPVIEGAFRETTTIKVAKTIATAAARVRALRPAATTLDDIVLSEDVRVPVSQLVNDVTSWKSGQLDWGEVSSSVLFYGPPGNGKTLPASAVAGTLQVPLISTSYSDCQRYGHQGDMFKALSDKVNDAVRTAPCVFFVDELDSFTHRDRPNRRSDYIVGVVNGLLEHLSRLNDTPGVIVLGATNFLDMIDPAIIRPGRFDLKVELTTPDRNAILRMLRLGLGDDAETLKLDHIADQLLGVSGAQVSAFVREARGLARAACIPLRLCHLATAAARISPALDPDVLWRVAVHEAGHIVVGYHLGIPVPRLAAITNDGGYVRADYTVLQTFNTALDQAAILLAGHAAERTILGNASNGAGLGANSDLSRATNLVASSLYEWGLSDRLACSPYGTELRNEPSSHEIREIENILQKQHSRAVMIIENNTDVVEHIANALMARRELGQNEILALLGSADDIRTGTNATRAGERDA